MTIETVGDALNPDETARASAGVTTRASGAQYALDSRSATTGAPKVRQRTRRRTSAVGGAHWRVVKWETLEALRDLRAEAESGFLRSPDLAAAALYRAPRPDEIPQLPWAPLDAEEVARRKRLRRMGRMGRMGLSEEPQPRTPPPPAWDDESEWAQSYRAIAASREEALAWRLRLRQANRFGPHTTWGGVRSHGERGGIRASQRAFPAAWGPYLLRYDPHDSGQQGLDGLDESDGWGSRLGRAFKRVERDYSDPRTPLWTALWVYTEPYASSAPLPRTREALGLSQAATYRWLDAGARRIWAHMMQMAGGREQTRDERAAADEAEALAWRDGKGE